MRETEGIEQNSVTIPSGTQRCDDYRPSRARTGCPPLRTLDAEAGFHGVKDLVSHGAVLVHHAQCLGVHLVRDLTVFQGLGRFSHSRLMIKHSEFA